MSRRSAPARGTVVALALAATLAVAQASGGRAPATAASTDASSRQAWERMHRASRIIGMDVVNRQGEKVGDIEDLVLDRNGSVAWAVVSTGGFLGVGDRLHAVPWRSLEADGGTGHFILEIDKETLGKAPGFDNTSFPDVSDPKWIAENRKHFPVASSAASRSSTTGSQPPRKKERDDAGAGSGRSAAGNDIGPTTSTARRGGPAAGSAAPTAPDPGSTSGTAAGSSGPNRGRTAADGTAGSATGGTTNPTAGTGGAGPASAPGTPPSGPIPGTTK